MSERQPQERGGGAPPDDAVSADESHEPATGEPEVEAPQEAQEVASEERAERLSNVSRRARVIAGSLVVILTAYFVLFQGESVGMWLPFMILFVTMLTGIPIAFSMAIAGFVGIWMAIGLDPTLGALASVPQSTTASYTLSTIPMFVLMAEFLSQGRITRHLFRMAANWLAPFRGGLAMAVVGANGIFGAMSGSSIAAAGLLASVSTPEMRRYGYNERISLGTVAAAGTFAAMIPPSIAMIIYGVATETSIGRMFAAGFVPAAATVGAYVVLIYVWARFFPGAAPRAEKVPMAERLRSLRAVMPAIPLIVLVLGGIYSGVMTPTEAGAVGALGALIVSVAFGGLRWHGFKAAIMNATAITSMIMLIIVGAQLFGMFLTTSGTTRAIVAMVTEADVAPGVTLGLLVAVYLILGTFMSQSAILLLTLPLTFPLAMALGFDAIWFGVVIIKTVEIGLATPPLGLNVYIVHGVAGGKLNDVFTGSAIFLIADAVVLLWILFNPGPIVRAAELIFGG